eukprot:45387-Hanusia_phi.AAC.1
MAMAVVEEGRRTGRGGSREESREGWKEAELAGERQRYAWSCSIALTAQRAVGGHSKTLRDTERHGGAGRQGVPWRAQVGENANSLGYRIRGRTGDQIRFWVTEGGRMVQKRLSR